MFLQQPHAVRYGARDEDIYMLGNKESLKEDSQIFFIINYQNFLVFHNPPDARLPGKTLPEKYCEKMFTSVHRIAECV